MGEIDDPIMNEEEYLASIAMETTNEALMRGGTKARDEAERQLFNTDSDREKSENTSKNRR